MGHHEYRKAQATPQIPNQRVEFSSRYWIEPGGRLVEKDDFRVEREGAREARALAHPPRQLGRVLLACPLGKSHDADLERCDLIHQPHWHLIIFLQRDLDILSYRQRTEKCTILKQHPPTLFDLPVIDITHRQNIVPEHLCAPGDGSVEPDDGPQQD